MHQTSIRVETDRRFQFVSISDAVKRAIAELNVAEGLCVISSTHTTAAVTINEDYDPDVGSDLEAASMALINSLDVNFRHGEGNSDSHLLTSYFGRSETVEITDGRLDLGRWQGVFLAEFDGPRTRTVRISVLEG